MANPIYSWTQVQLAMECGQKFIWRYRNGYKERVSANSRPMILGSAVHKGLETYLRLKSERPTLTHQGRLVLAVDAIRDYLAKETKPHQQRWDWGSKSLVFDSDYYAMMREVEVSAIRLIEQYTPYLPNWAIATKGEVLPGRYVNDPRGSELALEWTIRHVMPGGQQFQGIVDAVMKNLDTGEIFLVDWKVKSKLPYDEMASLDGQLHLYAAILNENGGSIRSICMYQMLADGFSDPELGEGKNLGQVMTGRKSYATTWDWWSTHLPMGVKASHYEATMKPKMKQIDYFIRPVFSPVTKHSSQFAIQNFQAGIDYIEAGNLPARLSTYTCQSCVFAPLCDAKRYGTDVEFIVDQRFERSTK